jgi:hypothetical protein
MVLFIGMSDTRSYRTYPSPNIALKRSNWSQITVKCTNVQLATLACW